MALERTPLAPEALSPAVAKAVGPSAPAPVKMMAARGLAPMGPKDLVTALYQLSLDADEKIAQAATQSAEKLPPKVLSAALGEALDPRVLDYFALRVVGDATLVERVLLNSAVADETFVSLAEQLSEASLEILAGNQQRLLRHPQIIEAIYFNKRARMSTVDRLLEMAVRNNLTLDVPQYKQLVAQIMGSAAKEPPAAEPVEDAASTDPEAPLQMAEEITAEGEQFDEVFEALIDETWDQGPLGNLEFDAEEQGKKQVQIAELSVNARIRLATLGSVFHRTVLIRDTNRLVAMAAIESPAVSEQEAARHAGNRGLSEDVIRYICGRRDWQKSYQIKLNLVNNPKCPLAHAMKLLSHLRANDVRMISRSKNVPAAIARAAKQHLQRKSGG